MRRTMATAMSRGVRASIDNRSASNSSPRTAPVASLGSCLAMNARSVVSARRAGMSSPSADTDADTAHMMPNVRSVRRCRAQSPADHRVMSSLADDDEDASGGFVVSSPPSCGSASFVRDAASTASAKSIPARCMAAGDDAQFPASSSFFPASTPDAPPKSPGRPKLGAHRAAYRQAPLRVEMTSTPFMASLRVTYDHERCSAEWRWRSRDLRAPPACAVNSVDGPCVSRRQFRRVYPDDDVSPGGATPSGARSEKR